jgi:mannose-6-phosphate isomerase
MIQIITRPLLLKPQFYSKIWGADDLFPKNLDKPAGQSPIGESWIASGESEISSPSWEGQNIDQLVSTYGSRLTGEIAISLGYQRFPLLIKLLGIKAPLSVQVHPGISINKSPITSPEIKNEMWYVLTARPEAFLIYGPDPNKDIQTVKQLLESGDIESSTSRYRLNIGDVVMVPSGTIHSAGGGLLIYELQQPLNKTYRIYDWGRASGDLQRNLQIEEGLIHVSWASNFNPQLGPISLHFSWGIKTYIGACRYFAAEILEPESEVEEHTFDRSAHVLTTLEGTALIGNKNSPDYCQLEAFQTALLPACLSSYIIRPEGKTRIIKSYVPDMNEDIVRPLLAHKVSEEAILNLANGHLTENIRSSIVQLRKENQL